MPGMEKKNQSNFSSDELKTLTSDAVTYCCINSRYTMMSVTRNVCL